ncbi:hypothetical protein Tco_0424969 [Tanacetum coccineum]
MKLLKSLNYCDNRDLSSLCGYCLEAACASGGSPAGIHGLFSGRLVVQEEVVIVCHEKVVRISLEGDEILRVQVPGVTPVAKSPYRLAPSEMQKWSEQLHELQDKGLELLRKEKLYVKVTKSEAVKNWEVPKTPSEI